MLEKLILSDPFLFSDKFYLPSTFIQFLQFLYNISSSTPINIYNYNFLRDICRTYS